MDKSFYTLDQLAEAKILAIFDNLRKITADLHHNYKSVPAIFLALEKIGYSHLRLTSTNEIIIYQNLPGDGNWDNGLKIGEVQGVDDLPTYGKSTEYTCLALSDLAIDYGLITTGLSLVKEEEENLATLFDVYMDSIDEDKLIYSDLIHQFIEHCTKPQTMPTSTTSLSLLEVDEYTSPVLDTELESLFVYIQDMFADILDEHLNNIVTNTTIQLTDLVHDLDQVVAKHMSTDPIIQDNKEENIMTKPNNAYIEWDADELKMSIVVDKDACDTEVADQPALVVGGRNLLVDKAIKEGYKIVEPNTDYTLSGDDYGLWQINWFTADKTYISGVSFDTRGVVKTKKVTSPSNAQLATILHPGYRVKFEKGSVATDWTPAPEDLQANIDIVESDQFADELISMANEPTSRMLAGAEDDLMNKLVAKLGADKAVLVDAVADTTVALGGYSPRETASSMEASNRLVDELFELAVQYIYKLADPTVNEIYVDVKEDGEVNISTDPAGTANVAVGQLTFTSCTIPYFGLFNL